MQSPDHEDRSRGQGPPVAGPSGPGEPPAGSRSTKASQDPVHEAEESLEGGEYTPASSFKLIRRITLGIIQAIGEGAELVGASVEEELTRFLRQTERKLVLLALFSFGGALATAGGVLFLQRLIGNWPLVLSLFGFAYLVVGLMLFFRWREPGDGK